MLQNYFQKHDDAVIITMPRMDGSLHKAIVDLEDLDRVRKYRWGVLVGGKGDCYVVHRYKVNGRTKNLFLHRYLVGAVEGQFVDHISRNTLDNRKSNLRLCSPTENQCNRQPQKNSSSQYKGVFWIKKLCKWRVKIVINCKHIHGGYFINEIEAAKKYNELAVKYHGEFAKLNEIKNDHC